MDSTNAAAEKQSPLWRLPQELRDMIYEHALTFREDQLCDAQLLATCRRVLTEASTIYQRNTIQIDVRPFGVYVQGRRSGKYLALGDWDYETATDYGSIKWPQPLRKMNKVRISVSILHHDDRYRPLNARINLASRHATATNVLFSLCSFLHEAHCITSICIELADGIMGAEPHRSLDICALNLLGIPVLRSAHVGSAQVRPTFALLENSVTNINIRPRLTEPPRNSYSAPEELMASHFKIISWKFMTDVGPRRSYFDRLVRDFMDFVEEEGLLPSDYPFASLEDLQDVCLGLRIMHQRLYLPASHLTSDVKARMFRLEIDALVARQTLAGVARLCLV